MTINALNIPSTFREYEAILILKRFGWPTQRNSDAVVERLIEIHPSFIKRKFDCLLAGVQLTLVQRVCYAGYNMKVGRQSVVSFVELNSLAHAPDPRYLRDYEEREIRCRKRRESHIKILLAKDDVNVNAVDDNGYTALGYTLSETARETRLLLCKEGLDIHATKSWIEDDNREQQG